VERIDSKEKSDLLKANPIQKEVSKGSEGKQIFYNVHNELRKEGYKCDVCLKYFTNLFHY